MWELLKLSVYKSSLISDYFASQLNAVCSTLLFLFFPKILQTEDRAERWGGGQTVRIFRELINTLGQNYYLYARKINMTARDMAIYH